MQNRPQATTVALIVVGVVIAGLLLFAFLTRGSDSGSLTGRTWQLAAITGKTPAFQGVIPPAEQPLYTIAFTTGGSFAARADCNAITGTYTLDRGDAYLIPLPLQASKASTLTIEERQPRKQTIQLLDSGNKVKSER